MASTIRKQIRALQAEFEERPERLLRHVLRVVDEARELATCYDVDPERTELATWGHDLFRAHTPAQLLSLAHKHGVTVTPEDERTPVMLHGPIAAVVLGEEFGIRDDEVTAAVRDHTAGLEEMPIIAKILLIADKVEPRKRKRTPIMADIRRLARRDLDTALLCWADWKWFTERGAGVEGYPQHWQARKAWVASHHAEIGLPARSEGEGEGEGEGEEDGTATEA